MNQGKIIVIEGACDGIGKTTQYELLYQHLLADKNKVTTHHFPSYNVYQGKGVEEYLKGNYGKLDELSPYFINNLYASDRAITWYTKLKTAYEKGDTLLLDRYTTSSLIYQSAFFDNIEERTKFINYASDYEYNKLGMKEPDIVIFLTAPFELVNKLREERPDNAGIANDIYERNVKHMKKIYDNSLFVAKYLSWNIIECSENGKMKDINAIHNEIYELINKN